MKGPIYNSNDNAKKKEIKLLETMPGLSEDKYRTLLNAMKNGWNQ